MEVHPDPANALCDAACMLPLAEVESLVSTCSRIHNLIRSPE
jgi:3-deoxy-D-manno-octulosonic acid (KDO) 8-phosphate synthase